MFSQPSDPQPHGVPFRGCAAGIVGRRRHQRRAHPALLPELLRLSLSTWGPKTWPLKWIYRSNWELARVVSYIARYV